MADYFQINASHPLIHYDRKTKKHTSTSYGAAFEIIRGVFEGSEKLAAQTRSTKIGGKIDSVEAAAVEKDGKIVVFAINKSPRSVPFKLVVDGLPFHLSYEHQALSFDDINELKTFELENSVVTEFPSDSGLLLPPLLLNRIELMK